MSDSNNICGFYQLQQSISHLHEGYKELRSYNESLLKELDEKTKKVIFLEQQMQQSNKDTDAERSNELIKLQASIIRSLRKEIRDHSLANNAKNHCNSKLVNEISILKEKNAKLKKDNELLTDILLCRCEENTKHNKKN